MRATPLCRLSGDKVDSSRRNLNEGGFTPVDFALCFVSVITHDEQVVLAARQNPDRRPLRRGNRIQPAGTVRAFLGARRQKLRAQPLSGRAAALSYTTLLALIPLLVVAISVTSSLLKSQGEEKIYEAIDKLVSNVMPPATTTFGTSGALLNLASDVSVTLLPTNAVVRASSISSAKTDARVDTAQKEAAQSIHAFIQKRAAARSGLSDVAAGLRRHPDAGEHRVHVQRHLGRHARAHWLWRIVLYWTTITLGPLLIAGALGLAGESQLQATKTLVERCRSSAN